MSMDPMQCAQSDLMRLMSTGALPLKVTYDRRPVNGKDTLTVRFPSWVGRIPNCQEFVATFCAGIITQFQGVDIRIVIGTPAPGAMPVMAVALDTGDAIAQDTTEDDTPLQ